jgi:predicted DNA-binding transcriptional regulator AlpA
MNNNTTVPSTGFVRLSTILKLIPISKSTWWAGVKSGRFPKSIKLSSHITVWRAEDILEIITGNGIITRNDNNVSRSMRSK